jgi:hypothetical protein
VLQRIPARFLTPRVVRSLQRAAQDERVLSVLAALPVVTRSALALLSDRVVRESLTTDCLVAAGGTFTLRDVRVLAEQLSRLATQSPVMLRSLVGVHWFLSATEATGHLSLDGLLAPPLIMGLDTPCLRILPITTTGGLLRETLLLHHCAIQHEQEARLGQRFFYAITAPNVRATLCLKRTKKRGLVINDLRGQHNHRVPNRIWKAIREWHANGITTP